MLGKKIALSSIAVATLGLTTVKASDALNASSADDQATAGASGQLTEIVVTAQRRAELLQDVPIAITALTSPALEQMGVADSQALGEAVPGMTFTRIGSYGVPFIRGIGSATGDPAGEPSVATYVDGVYLAAPNADMFEFNNIQSISVLKGPQGTLFGRNATGGVIQVQTKDPTRDPEASIEVGYGNYDTTTTSVYGTAGLTDALAANIALLYRNQGSGYGHDLANGRETYRFDEKGVRVKLLWKPTDRTTILFAADDTQSTSTGEDYALPNGAIGRDGVVTELQRYNSRNGLPTLTNPETDGASVTIDQTFDMFSLKSISAFRQATAYNQTDVDETPGDFFDAYEHETQHNFSQEIHLASLDSSPLVWLAGVYYFNSRAGYEPITFAGIDLGGLTLNETSLVRTKSVSGFVQATYSVTSATHLTGGIRYTDETQDYRTETTASGIGTISPLGVASQSFSKPTWRLALDQKFTPDTMAYISYNRGIKSGGFSTVQAATAPPFKPEQLDSYEIGEKSEWLDHRLRINASAFWYEYKDIQVQIIQGPATFTQNAAAARIKGVDLDVEAVPCDGLTITGGAAYDRGKYKDFANAVSYGPSIGPVMVVNAAGNDTVRTPDWAANLKAAYKIAVFGSSITPSVTGVYSGKFYWSADNARVQNAYTLVNASVRWQSASDRYFVNLWGKNLMDRAYLSGLQESSYGDLTRQGEPRTFGISFGASF